MAVSLFKGGLWWWTEGGSRKYVSWPFAAVRLRENDLQITVNFFGSHQQFDLPRASIGLLRLGRATFSTFIEVELNREGTKEYYRFFPIPSRKFLYQLGVLGWLDAIPNQRGSTKALKVLAILMFMWSFSFYFRSFPAQADPTIGRIYEISNHGAALFLTRGEWLTHNILLAASIVCGLVAFCLDFQRGAFLVAPSKK